MIYCNTNYVTVNFVANAILAVNDAPAMTEYPGDCQILASIADATYINIGTMTQDRTLSILESAQAAHNANKPWVLDPVASGLGLYSDKMISELISCKPAVIRGNASEIIAVAKLVDSEFVSVSTGPKGVESSDNVENAQNAAKLLALKTGGAVAVSGEIDLVTNGEKTVRLKGGSQMLTKITGAGCSLGGVMAVYASKFTPFDAAVYASIHYNIASEKAEINAKGNGSFQICFIDELSCTKFDEIKDRFFDDEYSICSSPQSKIETLK